MPSRPNRPFALPRAACLAVAAALAALEWNVARAETTIAPRIGATAAWTDNIELAPAGDTHDDFIWLVTPGLFFEHSSLRLHALLDYQMQALFFTPAVNDSSKSIFHSGNFATEVAAVPDWLFLGLGLMRAQSSVNPNQPVTTNTLFPVGEIANRTTGDATAEVAHTFRSFKVDIVYLQGFVKNQEVNLDDPFLQNSRDHDGRFMLGSSEANAPVVWKAQYSREQTDYQDGLRYLHESAEAQLGFRVRSDLRLLVEGGRESDPITGVSKGGLDASSWAGGFDWKPGLQDELRILAGRRFFGNSYSGLWARRTRYLQLGVTYTEEPTTADNLFAQAPLQPVGPVGPGGAPIGSNYARITSDVFLLKQLTGQATLVGRLTEVGLSIDSERRTYLTLGGVAAPPGVSDTIRTADLFAKRRLGPKISVGLDASLSDVDLREGTNYREQHFVATLTDQLGPRMALNLRLDHDRRLGFAQDFKVNFVALTFEMGVKTPPVHGSLAHPAAQPQAAPGPMQWPQM